MYRLLIVEDEKWEREGLRDFINWKEWKSELVGCACDGVEGLEMARRYRPDIIITDIMMPRMDGIRMSESIRTFLPDAKILVLSGYDDSHYARQSIGFHACSYMLKPVEKDGLEEFLSLILSDLDRKRSEDKELEKLENQLSDYGKTNKERLLYNILEHRANINHFQELESLSECNWHGKKTIAIAYLYEGRENPSGPQISDNREDVMRKIRSIAEEREMMFLFGIPRKEAVLCIDTPRSLPELRETIGHLRDLLHNRLGFEIIISLGETGEGITGLSRSYAQARDAGQRRFLADYGELLLSSEIQKEVSLNWETIKPQVLHIKCLIDKIAHTIHRISAENTLILISEFLAALRKCRRFDRLLLDRLLVEVMKSVPLSHYINSRRVGKIYSRLSESDSLNQTRSLLTGFLEEASRSLKEKKAVRDVEIAEKVIDIIEEKYSEELDLKSLSEILQLSPYYIGSIFKSFMGKGFNKYLQDFRINKAEEILRKEEIKIYRLAKVVGITNQSYFCSLFKRKTGLSPGEYKDTVKRGESYV